MVAVPPPPGALDEAALGAAVARALAEAEARDFAHGRQVTPWVLSRVAELTGGASVLANVELARNNARVGTEIAAAIARLAP